MPKASRILGFRQEGKRSLDRVLMRHLCNYLTSRRSPKFLLKTRSCASPTKGEIDHATNVATTFDEEEVGSKYTYSEELSDALGTSDEEEGRDEEESGSVRRIKAVEGGSIGIYGGESLKRAAIATSDGGNVSARDVKGLRRLGLRLIMQDEPQELNTRRGAVMSVQGGYLRGLTILLRFLKVIIKGTHES